MKKRQFTLLMVLVLLFCSLTLSSCGQNSGDEELMDELAEPEITVKYLSGEYADQILKDGGERFSARSPLMRLETEIMI